MRRRLQLYTMLLALDTMLLALAAPGTAAAQNSSQIPGFTANQNKDLPVQIEAATLEVRDKNKMATFSGNVQVVQGDTTMKCQSLVVFYGVEGSGGASAAGPQPAQGTQNAPMAGMPQNAQNIRRIEARGGVTVTTKDQNASGDLGVYDLKSKTITLSGNVVVSQGKNILHGERVVVDMTTGNARVESGATATGTTNQNRVRALILPGKGANGSPTNTMSFAPSRPN